MKMDEEFLTPQKPFNHAEIGTEVTPGLNSLGATLKPKSPFKLEQLSRVSSVEQN
jgi:hypothetical protein